MSIWGNCGDLKILEVLLYKVNDDAVGIIQVRKGGFYLSLAEVFIENI